jgi:hypothetical protein
MYDPYSRDAPGLADPANNLIPIVPNDDEDIPVGIKALRIWNPNEFTATLHVITMMDDLVSFSVPALSLWTEPLRVKRVLTATSNGIVLHGYTDRKLPE